MKNYQVIARSNKFLYLDVRGKLLSIYVNHMLSKEDIINIYYDLPFVKNNDEAQELLDLKNECELNALEGQTYEG
jgi:hypothetical protein